MRAVARLRSKAWHIGQAAIAAAVAWVVAKELLGHEIPFFAPIAAVVSLGTSYGQRLRRVAEVTSGWRWACSRRPARAGTRHRVVAARR